jgi:hypothetical protein
MKASVANSAHRKSANQFDLKKNLDSLRSTIDMALAIDEELKIAIEKAETLRKQIKAEREERNQTPIRPAHRFVL